MNDRMISIVVFSVLLIILGLVEIGALATLALRWLRSRALARVEGHVVGLQPYHTRMQSHAGYGTHATLLHRAIVQYVAPDGVSRQVISSMASNTPPPVGTPMRVAYDPRDPGRG